MQGGIDKYNMQRKSYAPSWFCLQDYTEIQGQQNIKFKKA
jgi:hypothetical protein